ncbi:MAG: hexose kinase [Chloroflexi bacterium]|nr:hexose kinase [Chloroflexota bacterium]
MPTPHVRSLVTVTPNSTIDRVVFVDHFAFGETVRSTGAAWGMGGKSAVAAFVLGQLGMPSTATGFVAGETGRRMEAMLQGVGVQTSFLPVAGETRTTYVIARTADGSQCTITVESLEPTPADAEALVEHALTLLPPPGEPAVLFAGGSLPPGLPVDWYAQLIRRAKARGVFTVLDTSGRFLAPNVAACPDLIKPNEAEIATLVGHPVETPEEAVVAAHALQERGVAVPVVTLGARGAVAATPEGTFFVPPLRVPVVSTAGAGDGFSAGLIQARLNGASWPEALRWAGAVAAAVLLRPGTGVLNAADAHRLHADVRVERR